MKNTFLKIRISEAEKKQLVTFAKEGCTTLSEVVRCAVHETVDGEIAGLRRRKAIANLRRSINLMVELFSSDPVDVGHLAVIAARVRRDAGRVLE